ALGSRIQGLKEEIAALENEKKGYDKIIADMKKLDEEKVEFERKIQVIAELQAQARIPVRILDEVARLVPENRIWLDSLTQEPQQLTLSGVALDNATIAAFMVSIKQSPLFADAELSRTAQTVVAGQKLKSFGLTCGIKGPTPAPEGGEGAGQANPAKKGS
ncbi:MAG: PilN domain-containing protein, partial [Thermodesulfobacteriota bacterium]